MSETASQSQTAVERVRCIKCRQKDATQADQMCDNCRFLQTLDRIIGERKAKQP